MERFKELRGERPVNPLHYQQPTAEELFARIRQLEAALREVAEKWPSGPGEVARRVLD